jgi:hypothetical protein
MSKTFQETFRTERAAAMARIEAAQAELATVRDALTVQESETGRLRGLVSRLAAGIDAARHTPQNHRLKRNAFHGWWDVLQRKKFQAKSVQLMIRRRMEGRPFGFWHKWAKMERRIKARRRM